MKYLIVLFAVLLILVQICGNGRHLARRFAHPAQRQGWHKLPGHFEYQRLDEGIILAGLEFPHALAIEIEAFERSKVHTGRHVSLDGQVLAFFFIFNLKIKTILSSREKKRARFRFINHFLWIVSSIDIACLSLMIVSCVFWFPAFFWLNYVDFFSIDCRSDEFQHHGENDWLDRGVNVWPVRGVNVWLVHGENEQPKAIVMNSTNESFEKSIIQHVSSN